MKQEGKFNLAGLLILAILFYGGYALIKMISTSLMQSQIENEVVDTFGVIRGSDLTERDAVKAIRDILLRNDVIFDERDEGAVDVEIHTQKGKIYYYFKYEVETDYLFFKKRQVVEVDEEMQSFR